MSDSKKNPTPSSEESKTKPLSDAEAENIVGGIGSFDEQDDNGNNNNGSQDWWNDSGGRNINSNHRP